MNEENRKSRRNEIREKLKSRSANQSVQEMLEFMTIISNQLETTVLDESLSKELLQTISDMISNESSWKKLKRNERVFAITQFLHLVDKVLFESTNEFKEFLFTNNNLGNLNLIVIYLRLVFQILGCLFACFRCTNKSKCSLRKRVFFAKKILFERRQRDS